MELIQRATRLTILINSDWATDRQIGEAIIERAAIRNELSLRDHELMEERGELPNDD